MDSGGAGMSDQTRMTLLHSSTNDLIEELLMWRGRAYQLLDRIAELEAESERFTVHSDIERQDDKWIPEVQE